MGRPESPPGGPGGRPPGRYCEPSRRTPRVRAWGGRSRLRGVQGVAPRADTASHPEGPRGSEHGATPGGYGGKPPGVAFIGVPTGARKRRQRCPDGGPEHRYECYTETPRYVSRPNYECISGEVRSRSAMSRLGRALTVRGPIANALMSGSRASLSRRNASLRQVWPILHESTNVVRLTSPVGENDRNVRDENRENGRYSGEPPEVVEEQEDRDTKADGAEGHHDEVPALPVGDVLGHRTAGLRDQRNVSVAVTPCDPHLSKVSLPRANTHPGPQRPLRSERSPRRLMPEDARRAGPGPPITRSQPAENPVPGPPRTRSRARREPGPGPAENPVPGQGHGLASALSLGASWPG